MSPKTDRLFPIPSVRRLPLYLRLLRKLDTESRKAVSCTYIANEVGFGSVQVRKDLAMTGIVGRPKVGYPVPDLIAAIESFLGWNHATDALLVGTGSLGSAILGYDDFKSHGLNIVAAFDADPKKIGRQIHGKPVFSIEELVAQVAATQARIGIVTVPAAAAQEVTDLLIQGGIRAIWNFSPANLEVPEGTILENVQFVDSLAVLSQRLHQSNHPSTND